MTFDRTFLFNELQIPPRLVSCSGFLRVLHDEPQQFYRMELRVMLEDQTEHLGRKKFGCWQEMESFKQTGWHKRL